MKNEKISVKVVNCGSKTTVEFNANSINEAEKKICEIASVKEEEVKGNISCYDGGMFFTYDMKYLISWRKVA